MSIEISFSFKWLKLQKQLYINPKTLVYKFVWMFFVNVLE